MNFVPSFNYTSQFSFYILHRKVANWVQAPVLGLTLSTCMTFIYYHCFFQTTGRQLTYRNGDQFFSAAPTLRNLGLGGYVQEYISERIKRNKFFLPFYKQSPTGHVPNQLPSSKSDFPGRCIPFQSVNPPHPIQLTTEM